MFVEAGFNAGVRPAMDAELLVGNQVFFFGQVLVDLGLLRLEVDVIGENTGPGVVLPVERGIRVAITFHFFLSIWLQ